jgi:mannonate dehydratase
MPLLHCDLREHACYHQADCGLERFSIKRRHFLSALALAGAGLAAYRFWPEDGFVNPCLEVELPEHLAQHPLVLAAWQGIKAEKLRDCHVHLIGTGDSDSGIQMNPDMSRLAYPVQWVQRQVPQTARRARHC